MNQKVYPWLLVGLLSFNFGVVYFDRNTLNFLMPLIQPELHLSNEQVGMLGSALSLSWALAGLVVGRLSDVLGRRKLILVIAAFIFSAASLLSGWVTSFSMLLVTRLLMGLAEGGVMPISQALISAEIDPARRGLAMGIAQNFGANLLSNFPGSDRGRELRVGFRVAERFLSRGSPGCAGGCSDAVATSRAAARGARARNGHREWLRRRERCPRCRRPGRLECSRVEATECVALCGDVDFVGRVHRGLRDFHAALPRERPWNGAAGDGVAHLDVRAHFDGLCIPRTGIVRCAWTASCGDFDVLDRTPDPLGALFVHQPLWLLFVLFALGAAMSGVFPLAMATIPSETVPPQQLATVLGLTMGLGEIIGGVFAPTLAGRAADASGLGATLWILIGLSAVTALLAFFIRETAPRVLQRRVLAVGHTARSAQS